MQKQALTALLDSVTRCTDANHSVVHAMDTIQDFASTTHKNTFQ